MNDLEAERSSHTYWLDEEIICPGDVLRIRFRDVESATPPASEVATDSEHYLAEQELYESEKANGSLEPQAVTRKWAEGALSFSAAAADPLVATFEGGREFIMLSLTWNKWSPDACRYSLSSFSQAEAVARTGSKTWAEGKLFLEAGCQVILETSQETHSK